MGLIYVLGLDVGGTKTAGGVVAFPAGAIVLRDTIATRPERPGLQVLEDTLAFAGRLTEQAEKAGVAPAGIGIGVAETVDLAGNVTSGATIAWRGIPIQNAFGVLAPAVVESDVRAAALGEALFGAGRPYRLFLYVTVGTGISSCLVEDGRPFPGARGNALVFASSPLTTHCTECGAVLHPILEQYASGPALVDRYNRGATARAETGQDVTGRAAAGEPAAGEIVRSAGEALGVSVAWLINSLDPEAVVVGGGLGVAGGLYWDSFAASCREHIWAESTRDLPIAPAALGADAGLIGAAAAWMRSRRG